MGDTPHRPSRFASAVLVLTALAVLASLQHCDNHGSCTLSASNYDQSCTQDSDCVAVFSGSFCSGNECACENAAINVSAQAQYEADFQSDHAPECPCPSPPPVACNHGSCGLREGPTGDAGAD